MIKTISQPILKINTNSNNSEDESFLSGVELENIETQITNIKNGNKKTFTIEEIFLWINGWKV